MRGSSTVTTSTAASLAAILPGPPTIGQPDGHIPGSPPPGRCTDLTTGYPLPLTVPDPAPADLVDSTQAAIDNVVDAAVVRLDQVEEQASERHEQLVHTSARAVVAAAQTTACAAAKVLHV